MSSGVHSIGASIVKPYEDRSVDRDAGKVSIFRTIFHVSLYGAGKRNAWQQEY